MYTLYIHPASQVSRRVMALLEIADLGYDAKPIALDKGEHLSPAYLAINPNHQVPTLVDGDVKIHESNAILRYLCHKHDLKDWYPANLARRAAVEQWLDWNQCRLGPVVVDIVLNTVFLGDNGDQQAIERGQTLLPELMSILSSALEKQDYLTGNTPTIADLSVASNITQLAFAKVSPVHLPIIDWIDRVNEIEGFAKTQPETEAA